MNINEYFQQVTVIGAAGKMGSGISLLLAWEMTRLKNRMENRSRTYRLNLIDARQDGLSDLLAYIETQTAKRAERQIDEPLIQTFGDDVLSIIHTGTDFRQARNSWLVFEAVPETERIKIDILRQLNEICTQNTFFLSNTSSIPIGFLDHETNLGGRIIGFHFYNPPAVQRLVELIPARTTYPELTALAHEIARRLGKTVVLSRDVAGFIGNGHFIRDALHAIGEVEWLGDRLDEAEAIYALNKVSQEGLLRPMGIFQLIDYVGVDVFSSIMSIMSSHINEEAFKADLIDRMVSKKVLGGQHPDGSQKDGFFKYKGRVPVCVYAPDRGTYISLRSDAFERVDRALGPLSTVRWKDLLSDPDRDRKLKDHFARSPSPEAIGLLASTDTLGARLTTAYLRASKYIGEKLMSDGVAESPDDVNTVLINGFGHLYGPFNDYATS